MEQTSSTRVAWFGPCDESFAWLFSRISEHAIVFPPSGDRNYGLAAGANRIVLACANRISYPHEALHFFASHFPELPVALALGSWWDGAGRTGLQNHPCLALPWHRWWDGWFSWLAGTDGALFGPSPTQFAHILTRPSKEVPARVRISESFGIVVANCPRTASTWELCAKSLGSAVSTVRLSSSWESSPLGNGQTPNWILWDDSCLDTFNNTDETAQCELFFLTARKRYPDANLFAAYSLPRWSVWRQAMLSGADEILVKPCSRAAMGRAIAS